MTKTRRRPRRRPLVKNEASLKPRNYIFIIKLQTEQILPPLLDRGPVYLDRFTARDSLLNFVNPESLDCFTARDSVWEEHYSISYIPNATIALRRWTQSGIALPIFNPPNASIA